MGERMTQVLEEILEDHPISVFNREWIRGSATDDDTVRATYNILRRIGLSDSKIASHATLLGRDPDTIERNYQRLLDLGLTNSKIASQAALLGMNPDTLNSHHQRLLDLGLSDSKIASHADLLGKNPDTVERNYKRLLGLGLSDSKIATLARLLSMNPDTISNHHQRLLDLGLTNSRIATVASLLARDPNSIDRNYQNHVGLLREDYQDRNSGREILLEQAALFGIPPNTLEANVQWFKDRNIDYGNGMALGTKPQTKRKKVAWILREVFDYRKIPENQKDETIRTVYDFVRDNPRLLIDSINSLEKMKVGLRKKAEYYK